MCSKTNFSSCSCACRSRFTGACFLDYLTISSPKKWVVFARRCRKTADIAGKYASSSKNWLFLLRRCEILFAGLQRFASFSLPYHGLSYFKAKSRPASPGLFLCSSSPYESKLSKACIYTKSTQQNC